MRLWGFVKLFFLLLINGLLFSYTMFQGEFVSWFLFYSILVLSFFTLIPVFFPFKGFDVTRSFSPELVQAGEPLTVTIHIKKHPLHPFFYLKMKDFLPQGLEDLQGEGRSAIFFFTFRSSLQYSYTLSRMPRGEYKWEKIELRLGDLFGLFEKKQTAAKENSIVIYPAFRQLRDWNVHHARQGESTVAFNRSLEEDLVIAGVRHYIPGDRLASIDWKQSARRNSLMTKEFESLKGNRYAICLYSAADDNRMESFEESIQLAASFINYFYQKDYQFSLAVFGRNLYISEYRTQIEHCRTLYRKLAVVNAVNQEKDIVLPPSLHAEVVILITVTMSMALVDKIQELQQYNMVIVCWMVPSLAEEEEKQICRLIQQRGIRVYQFKGKVLRYEPYSS